MTTITPKPAMAYNVPNNSLQLEASGTSMTITPQPARAFNVCQGQTDITISNGKEYFAPDNLVYNLLIARKRVELGFHQAVSDNEWEALRNAFKEIEDALVEIWSAQASADKASLQQKVQAANNYIQGFQYEDLVLYFDRANEDIVNWTPPVV